MNKLLLVDDHPIFRKGLLALIQDSILNLVIDEAKDGIEAIEKVKNNNYQVVVLDIDMPEKSGIDVLDFIRNQNIKTKVIILTMHNDELFFNEAFDRGAMAYVLKEDSGTEILECLTLIQSGVPFVSRKLKPYLNNRKNFSAKLGEIKEAISTLTNAELNTLKLVAENKSSKEIAELLFVTEKSVENYRSRICKKLNITGGSNTLYKWTITNREIIP